MTVAPARGGVHRWQTAVWHRWPDPRLFVTGEVTGGRDVNDVVELDVVRVEPTG
jgi:hypothetical protein